ncbi:hexosaminidase D-like isoform X2 [Varroa jacobsoni]|uniref:beta-N-acetylhexosaminidase n=1 Tax=Varroa destructor TaxID=109461 RepID=A0A7M7MF28_VARDE|nr:hexosaminidase D-like isoform X2 [Varroa destructor]XP_022689390.1 hexosaminidase D-like isoform X2 [Varroa jacobsoni]
MRSGRPLRSRPPTATPYHALSMSAGVLLPDTQMEGASYIEREEAMLERIRHGGRRGHPAVNFPHKIVHLDLKGAPLNVAYVEEVLPLLAKLGATGLLIEYEDMFPYNGLLAEVVAGNAYSKDDIRRILQAAKTNNLIVVPLVQTFGHLEFVLKLHEFKHLRELAHSPQALCPSHNASVAMVHEMLRQVIELHQGYITHIHIGSDEVFVLGECDICQERMAELGWTKSNLFINHVTNVVQFVKKMGVQTILWDDMFRQVDEDVLRKSPLVKLVEVMVWNYAKTINLAGVLGKYVAAGFPGVWAASAFKGASGPSQQMPDFRLHLLNHYSWMQLVRQFADKINLKGIAITGWQRFDHFGALCELFPVGIPALALCLGYLRVGRVDDEMLSDIRAVLKCNRPLPVFEETGYSGIPLICDFPGSQVLANIYQWAELQRAKHQLTSTNQYHGWMTDMNRKYRFSAPEHVIQGTRELPDLISTCTRLRESFLSNLLEVSDKYTAEEWVTTFIGPLQKWLDQLQADTQQMLAKDEWPKRPLIGGAT